MAIHGVQDDPLALPAKPASAIAHELLTDVKRLSKSNARPRALIDEGKLRHLTQMFRDPVVLRNVRTALRHAEAGAFVFPTTPNKVPLVRCWGIPNDQVTAVDREASDQGKKRPARFYGCSRDLMTIVEMWRAFPHAIPSVALGPSELAVIDIDRKGGGLKSFRDWATPQGGMPGNAPRTRTQSGGLHYYLDNPRGKHRDSGALRSARGLNLKTDFKAAGGQVVLPGAMIEVGKGYDDAGTTSLIDAMVDGSLPKLPQYVANALHAFGQSDDEDPLALPEKSIDAREPPNWMQSAVMAIPNGGDNPLAEEQSYDDWVRVGQAIHHDCGGSDEGRDLWLEWSQQHSRFDQHEFDKRWRSFGRPSNRKPVSGKTIKYMAREYGWTSPDALGIAVAEDDDDEYGMDVQPDKVVSSKWLGQSFRDLGEEGFQPTDFVRPGLVPAGTFGCWYGAPGAGKTKFAIHEALTYAHGLDHDPDLVKGGVLFVALETPDDTIGVVEAWRRDHAGKTSVSNAPFVLLNEPGGMLHHEDGHVTALETKIINAANQFPERFGVPCTWIIIDTLARAIGTGDENSSKDIGIITRAAERIMRKTGGPAVTITAHENKGKGLRGSSAILGNLHNVVRFNYIQSSNTSEIIIDKLKGARSGSFGKIAFKAVVVGQARVSKKDIWSAYAYRIEADPLAMDTTAGAPANERDELLEEVVSFARVIVNSRAAVSHICDTATIEFTQRDVTKAINDSREDRGVEPISDSTVRSVLARAVERNKVEVIPERKRKPVKGTPAPKSNKAKRYRMILAPDDEPDDPSLAGLT